MTDKEQIPINVTGTGIQEPIPKDITNPESSDLAKELGRINALVTDISKLTTYVIVVLLVMVATMVVTVAGIVISAYQNQSASNDKLTTQIENLNATLIQAQVKKK